jgi:hypothetical protein
MTAPWLKMPMDIQIMKKKTPVRGPMYELIPGK